MKYVRFGGKAPVNKLWPLLYKRAKLDLRLTNDIFNKRLIVTIWSSGSPTRKSLSYEFMFAFFIHHHMWVSMSALKVSFCWLLGLIPGNLIFLELKFLRLSLVSQNGFLGRMLWTYSQGGGRMKEGRGTCVTFKLFDLTYLHILRSLIYMSRKGPKSCWGMLGFVEDLMLGVTWTLFHQPLHRSAASYNYQYLNVIAFISYFTALKLAKRARLSKVWLVFALKKV